ncbi:(d)CMP kinase [Thermoproteota archaeon]
MLPRPVDELVITVAGHHGSGRSTNANLLARGLGLRYISTGMLFRERAEELGVSLEEMNQIANEAPDFDNWLDKRAKAESNKRGIVIDANLSAWMAEDPDLRIYVTCPFDVRVQRIADREGRDVAEVEQETLMREESEQKRYMEYYGIDLSDLSVYDVIINTSLFSIETNARILKCIVEEYVAGA